LASTALTVSPPHTSEMQPSAVALLIASINPFVP